MSKNLLVNTVELCTASLEYLIQEGSNLSTPQLQLIESVYQSLKLLLENIYYEQE